MSTIDLTTLTDQELALALEQNIAARDQVNIAFRALLAERRRREHLAIEAAKRPIEEPAVEEPST
jgi:hypothetical protein